MQRICTRSMFAQELTTLTQQYANLGDLQVQMSSGRVIQVGSEDPLLASRVFSAQNQITQLGTYQANTNLAINRLELINTSMTSAVDQLKHVKELLQQVGNGTLNSNERLIIGDELQDIVSSLVELANTQDSNGEYIYAGFNVSNSPFINVNGNYQYQGSTEGAMIDISPNTSIQYSASGFDLFGDILQSNGSFTVAAGSANTGTASTDAGSVYDTAAYVADTYTLSFVTNSLGQVGYQVTGASSGQVYPPPPASLPNDAPTYVPNSDIQFNGITFHINGQANVGDQFIVAPSQKENLFNTLGAFATFLQTPSNTAAELADFQQALGQTKASFEQIFDHLVAELSHFGSIHNQVDQVVTNNAAVVLQQTVTWSALADADLSQVASELMQSMTNLQAAQQAYVKMQDLFQQLLQYS